MADNATRAGGFAAAGLGAGVLIGLVLAPQPAQRENPATRGLDANLWAQTSAEYAACCRQTYRLAWKSLEEKLARRTKAPDGKKPAVVLDLDETVLDNSPYQTYLIRNGLTFSHETWARWEREHGDEVMLVPGAREFLDRARGAGVVAVFISNRLAKAKPSVIKVLERLKIDTADIDERLLLADSIEASSKEPRRELARKRYDVLMYVGDSLLDFSEDFRAPKGLDADDPDALRGKARLRRVKAAAAADRFGADWFILPNPVYGEWTKYGGRRPLEVLNPTTMRP
jgi:5'-nucleotidase (lipoprotein e(P4) family)